MRLGASFAIVSGLRPSFMSGPATVATEPSPAPPAAPVTRSAAEVFESETGAALSRPSMFGTALATFAKSSGLSVVLARPKSVPAAPWACHGVSERSFASGPAISGLAVCSIVVGSLGVGGPTAGGGAAGGFWEAGGCDCCAYTNVTGTTRSRASVRMEGTLLFDRRWAASARHGARLARDAASPTERAPIVAAGMAVANWPLVQYRKQDRVGPRSYIGRGRELRNLLLGHTRRGNRHASTDGSKRGGGRACCPRPRGAGSRAGPWGRDRGDGGLDVQRRRHVRRRARRGWEHLQRHRAEGLVLLERQHRLLRLSQRRDRPPLPPRDNHA